jgi:hypothetical protein
MLSVPGAVIHHLLDQCLSVTHVYSNTYIISHVPYFIKVTYEAVFVHYICEEAAIFQFNHLNM